MSKCANVWMRLKFKAWAVCYAWRTGYASLGEMTRCAATDEWGAFVNAARVRRGW